MHFYRLFSIFFLLADDNNAMIDVHLKMTRWQIRFQPIFLFENIVSNSKFCQIGRIVRKHQAVFQLHLLFVLYSSTMIWAGKKRTHAFSCDLHACRAITNYSCVHEYFCFLGNKKEELLTFRCRFNGHRYYYLYIFIWIRTLLRLLLSFRKPV